MMNKLFAELRRRNIFRIAGVYAITGWILAQISGVLESALNLPHWFDTIVVTLLLIGFPIALLFAWAFEMTPEGVKRTEAVADGTSITPKTGRKLDFAILGGLVLVALLVIWQGTRPASAPLEANLGDITTPAENEIDPASIAVLPFADLSPNKDQEYFSDGMAEEILNVLVRVDGMKVASRTSAFQFKGRELGIPEIARQLNVRHVLEGSVRKSGDTLRITAQLIDTANDRHLWSDTFDRPLTAENIFEIQDEIAQAIVDALGESIAVLAKAKVEVAAPTDNLTAYDLFLKARPLYQARNDLDKADELLTRALEQDPQFAGAWEMRASLQSLMVDYNYASTPRNEVEQKTSEFAKRALAINPNSVIAIATLARIQAGNALALRTRGNFEAILAGYDRALAINPHDASALNWRGLSYANLGYLDIALKDFTACVEAEPYYSPCIGNQLLTLGSLGRDAEAVALYKAALRNGSAMIYFPPIGSFARQEEEMALLSAFNAPEMLFGWHRHGELYDALRQPETVHLELATDILNFQKNAGELQTLSRLILAIRLGDYNRTLVNAEFWDAGFKNYRQTDNFKDGIKQSGIFDYWRKNGFPPQCKPVGKDDFVCD
jgi:TolB-like protein/Tfp pilus assembly protein PilF